MKLKAAWGDLEGTPEEIAEAIRLLGVSSGVAAAPLSPRLKDPPTNELLLHEYAQDETITRATRLNYFAHVRSFERRISPKSLLDASPDDVREWERGDLLERCRHLKHANGGGQTGGLAQYRCGKALFTWTVQPPGGCRSTCDLFQRQVAGPDAALKGLRHFYTWLLDRGLVRENPVAPVHRRHKKTLPPVVGGKRKYAPTVDEVRAIVAAARVIHSPERVGLVLALAKLGRRPAHTLLVNAEDLRDVNGPHAWIDFEPVRDRQHARNKGGRTKLRGNFISPLDDELRAFLRDTLLQYRARRWGYAWNEGPLFPAQKGGYLAEERLQAEVLAPILQHLADTAATEAERVAWRRRLDPADRTHITAGSFRHFFTTTLDQFGVNRDDQKRLRGDIVTGADEDYRHLTPARLFERAYRIPPLLAEAVTVDAAG